MQYLIDRTLIVVAEKCGSTTVDVAARSLGISEHRGPARSEADRVVCITRHPIERMVSSWRMLYVTPVLKMRRGEYCDPWDLETQDLYVPYVQAHGEDILRHPIRHWAEFTRKILPEYVRRRDGHFLPFSRLYQRYADDPRLECTTNLTGVLRDLGINAKNQNVGAWPWPDITMRRFVDAAGDLPHLELDWQWYDK
jgi:hypothetical protein